MRNLMICSALQNAASTAGLMITTEAMVVEIPKEEKTVPGAGMGGIDDMDYRTGETRFRRSITC